MLLMDDLLLLAIVYFFIDFQITTENESKRHTKYCGVCIDFVATCQENKIPLCFCKTDRNMYLCDLF